MYDAIIVGAGMAGLTAAIYAGRAGKKVVVFESKVKGGEIVESNMVSNYPGAPDVSGTDLMKTVVEQATQFSAEIKLEEVVKIEDLGESKKVVTDEDEYEAKSVILAMGTEPRKLSEKQAADAGDRPVSYCATCDGALYAGKPVVVVGSGNTAKYEMAYLEKICSKVYHIHHDDPIPADAEAVFVAIGRVPQTELVRDLVELDDKGYVVAGEDCKTSCPGIYVAGDCRTKAVRQLVTAAADGAIAASMV
jgi:thioredoxin reductase (NADPH)